MADRAESKYGHIYTHTDVLAIIDRVANTNEVRGIKPEQLLSEMQDYEMPSAFEDNFDEPLVLTFPVDEPVFPLRAKDRRAIAALRFYADHQSHRAPLSFTEQVERAMADFDMYRHLNEDKIKEPD